MKTLFSLVLLFCVVAIAPAQERVIDKAEFDAIETGVRNHRWKGEKYRRTITTSSTVAGRPQTNYSAKMVAEFGTSMKNRDIITSTFGGKPIPRKESLRIGDMVYTRSGSDPWSRKQYVPYTSTANKGEENPQRILSSQAEYRYLGQATLADKPAHVYLKTERQTSLNEKSGGKTESEIKSTYWVDQKGAILKHEYKSYGLGEDTHQSYVLMEWELDPSIEIIAPQTAP